MHGVLQQQISLKLHNSKKRGLADQSALELHDVSAKQLSLLLGKYFLVSTQLLVQSFLLPVLQLAGVVLLLFLVARVKCCMELLLTDKHMCLGIPEVLACLLHRAALSCQQGGWQVLHHLCHQYRSRINVFVIITIAG